MTATHDLAPERARVVLVGVDFGRDPDFDDTLDELALLASTAGDDAVARVIARRKAPDAALFVGSGKAEEIKALVAGHGAEGVLFDQALSPVQQRNLEQVLGVSVADRTALILEIFAQRARSHEGKLQVELAQLQYLATRLVRRWSHLERQRGGIGARGGPGERQMELDRRMIDQRIKQLKLRLGKVERQRQTQRRARARGDSLRVSLVGYTNAGKSTLFNALTKAGAYAADQLFATLDTTTRSLYLGDGVPQVALSDTVGFIRDLPHKLVEAFKATLQEAADAQLLLHVIDATSPKLHEQWAEVERVLDEIGVAGTPQVVVFNKIDALPEGQQPRSRLDWVERPDGTRVARVFLSAHSGEGLADLRQLLVRASLDEPLIPDAAPASTAWPVPEPTL
ncbi:MAG: GTPase HflX [Inhella sp.]|uniref:GTPase HflX n=1 Tax=Inhella sp. TaxID=1921806 RepID=UPI0022C5A3F3|nr:GTPase HflX [Inhella sp.]MCZ8236145.1 GTPase HflX [Inhella sp.]